MLRILIKISLKFFNSFANILVKFLQEIQQNFKTPDIFEKFVKNSFMYCYLWNYRVKYSENFDSEISTKFTENFENILGKLWERFSKRIR